MIWQEYAPNMTWDNVIGADMNSSYDCLRMEKLEPSGQMGGVDPTLCQVGENRPTPALGNRRTPIRNLYATATFWHTGGSASASESCNCTGSSRMTWVWASRGRRRARRSPTPWWSSKEP